MNQAEDLDLRSSPSRRIVLYVAGLALLAALAGGGFLIFKLATDEPGAPACDRIAELGRTDPRATEVVDLLVAHVESNVGQYNVVRGSKAVKVDGSTSDARCRSAIAKLDKAMSHGPFTRLVDCIATAKTARSAARCI